MMAILQVSTFQEFAGWLFSAVFFALMGLFWYWVSHSITELGKTVGDMKERINQMEKYQVRMEEQLSALRQEVMKLVNRSRGGKSC